MNKYKLTNLKNNKKKIILYTTSLLKKPKNFTED